MGSEAKALHAEADKLAEGFFPGDAEKRAAFVGRLLDICSLVEGKDFLLIHNPGGWGSTKLEDLLQWERSIVEGVGATMAKLGYQCSLMQYFRSNPGWRELMADIQEQTHFFTSKAKVMAAELEFVTRHFGSVQVLMIGVSQGAAFSNAVAQNLNGLKRVSSIELGLPFPYRSKCVITERTLVLNSNGLMPDALMEWDVPTILKTYLGTPLRWIMHKLHGKDIKFSYCINVPGHDYNWDYPEVQGRIESFLKTTYGEKVEGGEK